MKAFTNFSMPQEHNKTLLCLIYKFQNTTLLKNYRTIGLCNTTYKLITKIIANRLKPFLPDIISYTQSSSLPKRRASNNAIIVQEYISHFNNMKSKQANMILRVDLEKAFDKLEWSFIKETLDFFHFPPKLSKLIMSCISGSHMSILWQSYHTFPSHQRNQTR